MQVDFTQIGIVLVTGLVNIGAVGLLIKRYASSVDEHNKVLPAQTATLRALDESLKITAASMRELFDGRNDHERRLTTIETIHKIKGCDEPMYLRPNSGA